MSNRCWPGQNGFRFMNSVKVQQHMQALRLCRTAGIRTAPQLTRRSVMTGILNTSRSQVGKSAPAWEGKAVVNSTDLKNISSSDYKGRWLILIFYPADFSFVCPTELREIAGRLDKDFKSNGAEVVACSVDSVYDHLAWIHTPKEKNGLGVKLNYPLLSDITKGISAEYEVLSDEGDNAGFAQRATFITDPDGVLRWKLVNDAEIGRNMDEILRVLLALQYVREYGEACPATWKPGQKGISEDLKKIFTQGLSK